MVARPQDWPGVHCVDALLTGESLRGTWFDHTQEFAARNRGESFGPRQYAFAEVLELDPLPCWRHLSPAQYRTRMAGLVDQVITETEVRRQETGIQPLGPKAILAQDPLGQPVKTKRSFAPRAHAFRREVRKAMYTVYAEFVAAFRDAAEKLRGGDRLARLDRRLSRARVPAPTRAQSPREWAALAFRAEMHPLHTIQALTRGGLPLADAANAVSLARAMVRNPARTSVLLTAWAIGLPSVTVRLATIGWSIARGIGHVLTR